MECTAMTIQGGIQVAQKVLDLGWVTAMMSLAEVTFPCWIENPGITATLLWKLELCYHLCPSLVH